MDKVYPRLDDEAHKQLALEKFHIEQVAFSVKQGKPKTIEVAVSAATLECK